MRGGYCEKLHGKCRYDGQCSDAKCEYDHYEVLSKDSSKEFLFHCHYLFVFL